MSSLDLWLTPTISLSLIIESESSLPSFTRFLSQFALYLQPSLLRQALEYEISQRPGEEHDAISASTLRVVDYAYFKQLKAVRGRVGDAAGGDGESEGSALIYPEELAMSIATVEGILPSTTAFPLLEIALQRVLSTYALVEEVEERKAISFNDAKEEDQEKLKELWRLLKPETELHGLVSKQWQEIGFQGTSPTTDFRGLGMLALDSLLYFSRTYTDRAIQVVDEAVNGGERWYPLALAMMHMTSFALDLATSRDLQLYLLRSYQTSPPPPTISTTTPTTKVDTTPFHRLCSDLLLLFHQHWLRGDWNVMQFEQVSKGFQEAIRPWIRRGVLDGRGLKWWGVGLEGKGGIKLD